VARGPIRSDASCELRPSPSNVAEPSLPPISSPPPPPLPTLLPDKTIKLWKVFEKSIKVVSENNLSTSFSPASGPSSFLPPSSLRLPRLTHHDSIVAAVPRKVYANAHAYHINSISMNSDQETYISADDLRINLWNLNISDACFSACRGAGLTPSLTDHRACRAVLC